MQTTQESQLHSRGQLDYSRASVWTEPLLKLYFVVRRGHLQSCARAAFCRTTFFILSLQSTSSPLLPWTAFCFPHDCSAMSFHNGITVGPGDDGGVLSSSTLPKFWEVSWKARAGDLHPDLFHFICKSSGGSDTHAQRKASLFQKAAGDTLKRDTIFVLKTERFHDTLNQHSKMILLR